MTSVMEFAASAPPLTIDETGLIRVANTRVTLDSVLYEFKEGATPEEIVQNFDTLSLHEVYSVIAYYLSHRADLEDYLSRRQFDDKALRSKIERRYPTKDLRNRLEKRAAVLGLR